VADSPFFLKLTVTGEPDAILRDVTASTLERMGFSGEEAARILREFDAGLDAAGARARGRCDVQFRTDTRHLFIVVSVAGGSEWRLTRPLPSAD
jgi:hypothetical protein